MYDINYINQNYHYEGDDLGYFYKDNKHFFKVWSPIADSIGLCIYDDYNKENYVLYKMKSLEKGVWALEIDEDIEGKYYTFLAEIEGIKRHAVDPYAKAVSVNGEKGAIINLENTNPCGWDKHQIPKQNRQVDAIIYEINVRDISIDNNSGIKNKGRYLGLTEENTVGIGGVKTGLNHIKDLGVTHVQLLPIYDFASIDEKLVNPLGEVENSRSYNWGYDPQNYNAVEGSYSSNPYDPMTRIYELKSAIKAIHENGMGVIMDVVYNHMYEYDKSGFHNLMPGYFFRYDKLGKLADESGCGNAVASENSMVRKFIVDSVKYWAKEYKLDGFRFDLMGLIDVQTMKEVCFELKKINPSIVIIGEGWNMGATLKEDDKAIQGNASKLRGIGFFNDGIRDALRGNPFSDDATGFLSTNLEKDMEVKKAVVAEIDYSTEIKSWGNVEPEQVVNYSECHDNHTLYDKLNLKIKDVEKLKYVHRLGTSVVLLSQGVSFLHCGQEFLRTKRGVENSYNSNDTINKIDWERKLKNLDTVEYVKGLIAIRKKFKEFRLGSVEEIKEKISFLDTDKKIVAYTIKSDSSEFEKIIVIHNANEQSVEIDLTRTYQMKILVDKQRASIDKLRSITTDTILVDGLSTMVAICD